MAAIGTLSTFVRNVSTIQGLAQAATGYHFLLTAAYITSKMFYLPRLGSFAMALKFSVVWINVLSLAHRMLLILFNNKAPKSFNGGVKLLPSLAVELFFPIRTWLPATEIRRNIVGDLVIGSFYLVYGLINMNGDKTTQGRSKDSVSQMQSKILLLEVEIEHSRELQNIQRHLRDLDEIQHLYEEIKERQEMLLEQEKKALQEEIVDLEWLKKIVSFIGTGAKSSIVSVNDQLTTNQTNVEKSKEPIQEKVDDKVSILTLEKINLRLAILQRALSLVKPSTQQKTKAEINEDISVKETSLREKKKRLRGGGMGVRAHEETEILKGEIKKVRAELKMLKFLADPDALDEELNNLKKLNDEGYKLSEKQKKINSLISDLLEPILNNRDKVDEHLVLLRKAQEDSYKELEVKVDIEKLRIDTAIKSTFKASFDLALLEKMAAKLIQCDRWVQCLKALTDLNGIFHPAFDGAYAEATKKSDWKFWEKKEGQKLDKGIEKRDLYAAVIAELESMKELLNKLEEKVKELHPDVGLDFFDFKVQFNDYDSAVRNLFQHENQDDRKAKFDAATLMNVQSSLVGLRRAFQKEQDVLLKELKRLKNYYEKPENSESRWEKYSRPWFYIAVGVFLLAVRFLKSRDVIASLSPADQLLDTIFNAIFAVSFIYPLFFHEKIDKKRKTVVIRERDIPVTENVFHSWSKRMAANVKSYIKSLVE